RASSACLALSYSSALISRRSVKAQLLPGARIRRPLRSAASVSVFQPLSFETSPTSGHGFGQGVVRGCVRFGDLRRDIFPGAFGQGRFQALAEGKIFLGQLVTEA